MNNVLNVKRFGWLFKKTIMERPVQLSGFVLLILAADLLIYAFAKFTGGFEVAQNGAFLIGIIGGGCLLASFVFGHFSSNASGSSFLTLPASGFEKWLCAIFITGVLYLAIFLLFFRAMDSIFISFYHNSLDKNGPFYKEMYDAVQLYPFDGYVASRGFMMFFNFAGAMLVGSLYFNKAAFIKVALIAVAFCFGAFMLNLLIANLFFKDVDNAFPYFLVWITVGLERGRLELPGNILYAVNIAFLYIIPVILWGLSLLRLKEKEF
ncbi:hypothetical protein BH11BAC3_BH11BAC3_02100 [soil metagenome]